MAKSFSTIVDSSSTLANVFLDDRRFVVDDGEVFLDDRRFVVDIGEVFLDDGVLVGAFGVNIGYFGVFEGDEYANWRDGGDLVGDFGAFVVDVGESLAHEYAKHGERWRISGREYASVG